MVQGSREKGIEGPGEGWLVQGEGRKEVGGVVGHHGRGRRPAATLTVVAGGGDSGRLSGRLSGQWRVGSRMGWWVEQGWEV